MLLIPLFSESAYIDYFIENENHCQWKEVSNFDVCMNIPGSKSYQFLDKKPIKLSKYGPPHIVFIMLFAGGTKMSNDYHNYLKQLLYTWESKQHIISSPYLERLLFQLHTIIQQTLISNVFNKRLTKVENLHFESYRVMVHYIYLKKAMNLYLLEIHRLFLMLVLDPVLDTYFFLNC